MGRWDNAVYDVYVTDVCIVFGWFGLCMIYYINIYE